MNLHLGVFEEEESLQGNKNKHPNEKPLEAHFVGAVNVRDEIGLYLQGVVNHVS